MLLRQVYRDRGVMAVMSEAQAVVRRLFDHYRADWNALPEGWRPASTETAARTVADFLAGMTDRYALSEHQRFFGGPAELR
jgi:dGTPase